MASALLSPSVSRPSSPRNEVQPDLVSPDDGYDYNKIDTDPAGKATKPRDPPSPVAAPEAPQEIVATASYEDQDTETLPYIYQRQQGGWNAKVPDLETSKSNEAVPNNGVTTHHPQTQLTSRSSHRSKHSGQPKRLMLRWTMDRDLENRTLLVHDAKEDYQLQDPDLQKRVYWK